MYAEMYAVSIKMSRDLKPIFEAKLTPELGALQAIPQLHITRKTIRTHMSGEECIQKSFYCHTIRLSRSMDRSGHDWLAHSQDFTKIVHISLRVGLLLIVRIEIEQMFVRLVVQVRFFLKQV